MTDSTRLVDRRTLFAVANRLAHAVRGVAGSPTVSKVQRAHADANDDP